MGRGCWGAGIAHLQMKGEPGHARNTRLNRPVCPSSPLPPLPLGEGGVPSPSSSRLSTLATWQWLLRSLFCPSSKGLPWFHCPGTGTPFPSRHAYDMYCTRSLRWVCRERQHRRGSFTCPCPPCPPCSPLLPRPLRMAIVRTTVLTGRQGRRPRNQAPRHPAGACRA